MLLRCCLLVSPVSLELQVHLFLPRDRALSVWSPQDLPEPTSCTELNARPSAAQKIMSLGQKLFTSSGSVDARLEALVGQLHTMPLKLS